MHSEMPGACMYGGVTILQGQPEGGYLPAKERGLRRNQICRHLDLGLPTSRSERKCLLFKPPSPWCHFVTAALAD